MNLVEMRSRLRTSLGSFSTYWPTYTCLSDAELDINIDRAVYDLSRALPREQVAEITIDLPVEDEWFDAPEHTDPPVVLAKRMIEWDSEKVNNLTGTNPCVRDIDYIMDYTNGTIVEKEGGDLVPKFTYTFPFSFTYMQLSYKKSSYALDIREYGFEDDLFRIHKIIYPMSNTDELDLTEWDLFDDILYLKLRDSKLMDKKHFRILYHCKHLAPTSLLPGTWPRTLDEVLIKGSEGHAYRMVGNKYHNRAVLSLDSAQMELLKTSGLHTRMTSIRTKMDKVYGYLESALTSTSSYFLLAKTPIDNATSTDISSAINKASGRLDLIAAELTKVNTALTNAVSRVGTTSDEALVESAVSSALSILTTAESSLSGASSSLSNVDGLITGATASVNKELTDGVSYLSTALTELDSIATSLSTQVQAAYTGALAVWTDEYQNILRIDGLINSGEPRINAVNLGKDVAELYARMADAVTNQSHLMDQRRKDFLGEANSRIAGLQVTLGACAQRVGVLDSYTRRAEARIASASTYINKASNQVNAATGYLGTAQQRVAAAEARIRLIHAKSETAGIYVAEAVQRLVTCATLISQAQAWLQSFSSLLAASNAYLSIALGHQKNAELYSAELSMLVGEYTKVGEETNIYLATADRYYQEHAMYLEMSRTSHTTADNAFNQFTNLLRQAAGLAPQVYTTAYGQPVSS